MFLNGVALGALLAAAFAIAGCGESDADAAPDWLPAELRACLNTAGAVEATSEADLDFYREDRDRDNVNSLGFLTDRRVVADIFEPSERPHTGQAYRIYVIAGPDGAGEQPDPLEALEERAEHAVWFIPNGGRARPDDVDACFDAG